MSALLTARVLRSVAVLIALAAVIDPVYSRERSRPSPLVLINLTDEPATDVARRLRERRPGTEVIERVIEGPRVPCQPHERCVVVADGSRVAEIPADVTAPVLAVVPIAAGRNVHVRSVRTAQAHTMAAATVTVALAGTGVRGERTRVEVHDGSAVVGSIDHEWTADGDATIAVPWWPLGAGPRRLRVVAVPLHDEIETFDNAVDLAVSVGSERLPVLVFDARPSWMSTFVRRALEDDARFTVAHRARVAPALSSGTRGGTLDAETLDAAQVLVAGSPDALTAADIELIDRFVRVRGGVAVLLPERVPGGASERLFAGAWRERLSAETVPVGPLRATELLERTDAAVVSTVLAGSGAGAAIVMTPHGHGAIIVSGAMDAWRYREREHDAFDRFWRSLVTEASASTAAVSITFDEPSSGAAVPGTRRVFRVRHRSMQPFPMLEASAVARCDDGPARTIRLWPAGPWGVYEGALPVTGASACSVEAAVGNRRVTAGVAVVRNPSLPASSALSTLRREVTTRGGVVTTVDNLGAALHDDVPSATERSTVHPLRSPWWMLPFALCLSAEWWIRRRRGIR